MSNEQERAAKLLILEWTQAIIAVVIVSANALVGVSRGLGLFNQSSTTEYPVILSSSLFLVIGFYFARTTGAGPDPKLPKAPNA